jgi:hypothetical protein
MKTVYSQDGWLGEKRHHFIFLAVYCAQTGLAALNIGSITGKKKRIHDNRYSVIR